MECACHTGWEGSRCDEGSNFKILNKLFSKGMSCALLYTRFQLSATHQVDVAMVVSVPPQEYAHVQQGGREKDVMKVSCCLIFVVLLASNSFIFVTGICTTGCIHGDCVEPDVCQCHSGWTGYRCDQGK